MFLRFLFILLALTPLARATSVVPPNLTELVDEADAIYRGRVTAVEARHVAAANGATVIKTFVTVAVDHVLKGAEVKETTLELLGGTIGDETLEVGGMPQFIVGERGIVFVQGNGRQFCPLVRFTHGRYRIEHDAAGNRDYMARENRRPLKNVTEVQQGMSDQATAAPTAADVAHALTPAAFESEIAAEIGRHGPLKAQAP